MEHYLLHMLSLPPLVQDALVVLGVGFALLASLTFIQRRALAAGPAHRARQASA